MMENCISSLCIVSVFTSHQHCFCVVKRKCVCNVYKPSIQKQALLKWFASRKVGYVETPIL